MGDHEIEASDKGDGNDDGNGAIVKVNYVLGCAYIVLGILAVLQVVTKFKVERKFKTNVIFPAEILLLCIIRTVYFFASLATWADKHTPDYEKSFALLQDTFPELIFVAIYVLLVASWGTTWAKARLARPFEPYQFWITYGCVVAVMFITALVLSELTSHLHLTYAKVLIWEAAFLVVLSCVCVLAALVFGLKLYLMLRATPTQSHYLSHVMRQLLFLVILASTCFALKGLCVYSISTSARDAWIYNQWGNAKFGFFWFTYYMVTELVPFVVVLVILQRKETSDKIRYEHLDSPKKTRVSRMKSINIDVGPKVVEVEDGGGEQYAYQDAASLGD